MKNYLIPIIFFLSFFVLFSQDFDDEFSKIEEKFFDYSLSLEELDKAISKCPDISKYPKLLFFKGSKFFDVENYPLAIKFFLEAKKYPLDENTEYKVLNNLGAIYSLTGQTKLAIAIFEEAISFAKKNNNPQEIYFANNNLLLVKIEDGDLKALEDFKTIFLSKTYNNNCNRLEDLSLISGYYLDNNLYKESKDVIDKASINVKSIDSCYLVKKMYYENLADISIKEKNYNKALTYLDSVSLFNINSNVDKSETFKRYKKVHSLLGNEKTATLYNDSIVTILENNIKTFNTTITTQTIEDLKIQETTVKHVSKLKIFLISIACILFLILIWLFYIRKTKVKLKRKLSFYRENYNSLWTSYQLSNKQLEKLKFDLIQQNKKDNYSVNHILKDLLLYLNTNSNNEHKYISSVKNEVINKLSESAPFLNEKEKLMCFFFSLNLPHKKIAEMLNKTEKSIDSYKYRINSKLKTNLKLDFDTFIKSLNIN